MAFVALFVEQIFWAYAIDLFPSSAKLGAMTMT